jgi:Protein of unknown function (DUF3299)
MLTLLRYAWLGLFIAGLICGGCNFSSQITPSETKQVESKTTAETKKNTPVKPEIQAITFAELDLPFEGESIYKEWMLSQTIRDLVSHKVKIRGYMSQSLFQLKNIKEFVLMRDKDCCFFGPGATPDHLIQVVLTGKATTSYTAHEIDVEGILTVEPYTGNDAKTWAVFKIVANRVERAAE